MAIEATNFSSYMVRQYGDTINTLRKLMTNDLYILRPVILLYKHIDAPDMWNINSIFVLLSDNYTALLGLFNFDTHIPPVKELFLDQQ